MQDVVNSVAVRDLTLCPFGPSDRVIIGGVSADVNSGVYTRELLKQHDPELGALLEAVYGDGSWRYPQTAPATWTLPPPQQQRIRCVELV